MRAVKLTVLTKENDGTELIGEAMFWRRLAVRIKLCRNGLKMSQTTLAKATGYHLTSISNIEHNRHRPDLFRLCAMAAVLQTTVSYLIGVEADGAR